MGIFSKLKKRIKKAIPKEAAPFLPALASIYGGPALASMFGKVGTGMLGQGIGAFLADAGTQELTSDRTRLESSLFSGIMGAARGITPDASLMADGKPLKDEAYKTAFGDLKTKDKILQGARNFARAPLDEPISMASASTIGVQAAPKLGYNEVERLSKENAARAAENARLQGLSYEESLAYARSYYYGSNPEASEEDFNQFMDYYNSDLQNPSLANGGRIGFADGSESYMGMVDKFNRAQANGSESYMGDVYGDRDRDSLDMKEFYKEYPETQVGSYINENRYKSEKIEKLEAKLNEIIDMRQRTADRSRNPENDGMPSLMEKLLDKEINSLYADRTNDDIRKSEAQKRDEMNARFAEENAKKQQMIQDYYNNLGVYARPGRAMGGIMNPRMGYARGTDPYMERYREKILDPLSEGGYEPGDGPERFPDYEGVNPFNEAPGNAGVGSRNQASSSMFQKARIMQIQKMFEAGQISREEAIIQMRNVMSAGTVRATMNMGGSMNMMDRPNFNYGSGRQTPQGDPIAPNVPPGMQMDLRPGGFVELGTEPRADDVPAMVGKDEFVLNDRAVAGIGKALTGRADPRAGARALYDLQSQMEATV